MPNRADRDGLADFSAPCGRGCTALRCCAVCVCQIAESDAASGEERVFYKKLIQAMYADAEEE